MSQQRDLQRKTRLFAWLAAAEGKRSAPARLKLKSSSLFLFHSDNKRILSFCSHLPERPTTSPLLTRQDNFHQSLREHWLCCLVTMTDASYALSDYIQSIHPSIVSVANTVRRPRQPPFRTAAYLRGTKHQGTTLPKIQARKRCEGKSDLPTHKTAWRAHCEPVRGEI